MTRHLWYVRSADEDRIDKAGIRIIDHDSRSMLTTSDHVVNGVHLKQSTAHGLAVARETLSTDEGQS